MRPFERQPDGSVALRLRSVEVQAIERLAKDMVDELGVPDDPGLVRLFPPAYPDDITYEHDYREMTRDDLERQKVAACQAVIRSIRGGMERRGRFTATLDPDTVRAWLGVMNDARLVLGTRLEITEDSYGLPLPPGHPQADLFNLYMYLGALEDALVQELLGEFGEVADPDDAMG